MADSHEFDIVVWGATGSTGRRVAHHMATRAGGTDLRWALGGRNQARLESVRSELGLGAADLPIVTADSHDVASLDALAARTRVVCSVVGPYAMFGSELLAACVRAGTHYCDLAAEAHWIRKMIDAHQAEAEQTGARIVHACGMDSIPSDLGVFFLQRATKERHGRPCPHIKMRVKFVGAGYSGGTAGCLFYGMEHRDPSIMDSMKDPYSLNPEGHRQGPEGPDKAMSVKVEYDEDLGVWTRPFFMGPMNTKIVRRSNALMGYPYGEDFRYEEAMLVGSGPVGWARAKTKALRFAGLIAAAAMPPTRWVLKRYVLPKPGEGPSQEIRETGNWEVILIGTMGDGNAVRARFTGEGDPSCESTSRMLTESALCLAQDADQIEVGGGSWTPSSAIGELLLPRLTSHAGLRFELETQPRAVLAGA